jgi:hypothetical protein
MTMTTKAKTRKAPSATGAAPKRRRARAIIEPLPLVDRAGTNLQTEITRLENRIKAPAIDNTIRACQVATELRLFLRDQTSAEKRKVVMKLLESGDDQILSAILSAPPCLSGLSAVR